MVPSYDLLSTLDADTLHLVLNKMSLECLQSVVAPLSASLRDSTLQALSLSSAFDFASDSLRAVHLPGSVLRVGLGRRDTVKLGKYTLDLNDLRDSVRSKEVLAVGPELLEPKEHSIVEWPEEVLNALLTLVAHIACTTPAARTSTVQVKALAVGYRWWREDNDEDENSGEDSDDDEDEPYAEVVIPTWCRSSGKRSPQQPIALNFRDTNPVHVLVMDRVLNDSILLLATELLAATAHDVECIDLSQVDFQPISDAYGGTEHHADDKGVAPMLRVLTACGAPKVKSIDIGEHYSAGEATLATIGTLLRGGHLPSLRSLRVDTFADHGILVDALGAPHAPPVQLLEAWDCTDILGHLAPKLASWPSSLTTLHVPQWDSEHGGVDAFTRALCSASYSGGLKEIKFHDLPWAIDELLPSSDTTTLDVMAGERVTWQDCIFLMSVLRAGGLPSLKHIDLSHCELEIHSIELLIECLLTQGLAPHLQSLNLLGCEKGDSEMGRETVVDFLPHASKMVAAAEPRCISLCGPLDFEVETSSCLPREFKCLYLNVQSAFDSPEELKEALCPSSGNGKANRALVEATICAMRLASFRLDMATLLADAGVDTTERSAVDLERVAKSKIAGMLLRNICGEDD